jgi:hypothetical protein
MTTNAFRSLHESPRGFNYRFVIDHTDLTTSADNTAQDITLITLPAYSVVKSAATYLKTPFQKTGTAAYNNNVLIVGDAGDDEPFHCFTANQRQRHGSFGPGASLDHTLCLRGRHRGRGQLRLHGGV